MTSVEEKRELNEGLEYNMHMIVAGEISELAVVAEGEERTTWFIWLLVCCCTISGLLFGGNIDFVLLVH
jgi:hypothetical protein